MLPPSIKYVQRYTFIYKQPVYKQLGLDLQKVKQILGLKHITISNFANKIFAYENIATTLHNHFEHIFYIYLLEQIMKSEKNVLLF